MKEVENLKENHLGYYQQADEMKKKELEMSQQLEKDNIQKAKHNRVDKAMNQLGFLEKNEVVSSDLDSIPVR